jgi:translation initiation factor 5A
VQGVHVLTAQLDVTDDGFLSLMSDDGGTKDDVKVPDGEIGDKIKKLFQEDGKDTSTSLPGRGARLTRPDVVVLTAMGEETAIDCKEAPK